VKTKDLTIQSKDEEICQKDARIKELMDQIDRMRETAANGDQDAAELARQLSET
jgi:hypothetical protein